MDDEPPPENAQGAPRPHDTLWYHDGNIILKTDTYLFRVHKGVLTKLSSVFREMFGVASVELGEDEDDWEVDIVQEFYAGIPLVSMVPDNGEDVAHLLRAVYERRYYMSNRDNHPFEKIAALLLLSTKYKFKDIQRDVVDHLLRLYPTALTKFDAVKDEDVLFYKMPRWACHFKLLKVARAAGVDVLLPALFYSCAEFDTATILENAGVCLDNASLRILLEGREVLKKEVSGIMWLYIAMSESCIIHHLLHEGITYAEMQLDEPHPSAIFDTTDLQDVTARKLIERWPNRICASCRPVLKERVERERGRIWESVPSYFGFPGWESLKNGTKD